MQHAPQGAVPLPLLAGPAFDVWLSGGEPVRGEHQGVQWADDGESLYLQLRIDDAEWRRDPAAASESAYRRLEAARQQHPERHWWRLWNYLGGILSGEGDDDDLGVPLDGLSGPNPDRDDLIAVLVEASGDELANGPSGDSEPLREVEQDR